MSETKDPFGGTPFVIPDSTGLSDYRRKLEEERAKIPARAEALRAKLAALGIISIIADYDGSGDSGQINDVSSTPDTRLLPPELESEVENLFYDFLEAHHGGWENNDGGRGEFNWDIPTGKFTLEHHDYYTDSNVTEHEGWEGKAPE